MANTSSRSVDCHVKIAGKKKHYINIPRRAYDLFKRFAGCRFELTGRAGGVVTTGVAIRGTFVSVPAGPWLGPDESRTKIVCNA